MVALPTGESVVVESVFRSCGVLVDRHVLEVDLIPLGIKDFDAILGMDWLAKYKAHLNYFKKEVWFRKEGT